MQSILFVTPSSGHWLAKRLVKFISCFFLKGSALGRHILPKFLFIFSRQLRYLSKDWLALSRIVDLLFWLVLENWPSNDQDLLKTFDFFTKWNNFQFYEGPQEWLVLKNYFIQLRRLVIVDILEQLSNGGRQETV